MTTTEHKGSSQGVLLGLQTFAISPGQQSTLPPLFSQGERAPGFLSLKNTPVLQGQSPCDRDDLSKDPILIYSDVGGGLDELWARRNSDQSVQPKARAV